MSYQIDEYNDKWIIIIPRPTDYPKQTKRSLLEQLERIFDVKSEPQAQD